MILTCLEYTEDPHPTWGEEVVMELTPTRRRKRTASLLSKLKQPRLTVNSDVRLSEVTKMKEVTEDELEPALNNALTESEVHYFEEEAQQLLEAEQWIQEAMTSLAVQAELNAKTRASHEGD